MELKFRQISLHGDTYYLVSSEKGITHIGFRNETLEEMKAELKNYQLIEDDGKLLRVEEILHNYFKGEDQTLDFSVDLIGTPFQVSVWQELLKIPYGETVAYLDIAKGIGDAKKVRAVGNAVGQNPILFKVPCHRVIGTDGKLHGFSAGIDLKIVLLNLENNKKIIF